MNSFTKKYLVELYDENERQAIVSMEDLNKFSKTVLFSALNDNEKFTSFLNDLDGGRIKKYN